MKKPLLQLEKTLHLLCAILFMAEIGEKIICAFEEKPMIWWRYIDGIFFILGTWREMCGRIHRKVKQFSSDDKIYCRML